MKYVCSVCFVLCSLFSFSQDTIPSYPLELTLNKTSNLVFAYAIKSVDRGSKDIYVQKARDIENVLQLKAGKENFVATNLSVITADGKLYSFLVSYSNAPATLNLSFAKDSVIHFTGDLLNEAELQNNCAAVQNKKSFLDIASANGHMVFSLKGVYLSKRIMYFHFSLHNYSVVDFAPGYVRFFVRDRHRARRTAQQDVRLVPADAATIQPIPGKSKTDFVFAFPQFTIPKTKKMVCEVSEFNGGRMQTLHIKHNCLLKARSFMTLR